MWFLKVVNKSTPPAKLIADYLGTTAPWKYCMFSAICSWRQWCQTHSPPQHITVYSLNSKADDLMFLMFQYGKYYTSKLTLYKLSIISFSNCLFHSYKLYKIQYNVIFKEEQQQAHGHCQICHITAVYIIGLEGKCSLVLQTFKLCCWFKLVLTFGTRLLWVKYKSI